jgi:tRNA threonylcarbamoyladenosine biosynthesis protein TsaB
LHLMVEECLSMAGLTLPGVGGLVVDVGPGLFTGIRVGLAAAKGFAMALGLPVVGLTSLEVLSAAAAPGAWEAAGSNGGLAGAQVSSLVVPVVDLRRGEVAWRVPVAGSTRGDRPAAAEADGFELGHGKADDLAALLRERFPGAVLLVGDGALRYRELLTAALPRSIVAGPQLSSAPVASLAMLGVERLGRGGGVSADEVAPVYLRDADVRINWTTRHDSPRRDVGEAAARGGLPPGGA